MGKIDLGVKAWVYPMPVLVIGSYGADGMADAMTAAWGGISLEDRISICVDSGHRTTANVLARRAFTVHVADEAHVRDCDFVGCVSANEDARKLEKTGFHWRKSAHVDAPIFEELPMVLECELVSYDPEDCRLVGRIVNVGVEERCMTESGKVDVEALAPIAYDPANHTYLRLGSCVGKAYTSGE